MGGMQVYLGCCWQRHCLGALEDMANAAKRHKVKSVQGQNVAQNDLGGRVGALQGCHWRWHGRVVIELTNPDEQREQALVRAAEHNAALPCVWVKTPASLVT